VGVGRPRRSAARLGRRRQLRPRGGGPRPVSHGDGSGYGRGYGRGRHYGGGGTSSFLGGMATGAAASSMFSSRRPQSSGARHTSSGFGGTRNR
jgi:hypothetical protein